MAWGHKDDSLVATGGFPLPCSGPHGAPQLQRLQKFYSVEVQEVGQRPHLEGTQLIKGAAYLNAVFILNFYVPK